jgi:hypothetical protein
MGTDYVSYENIFKFKNCPFHTTDPGQDQERSY